MRKIKLLLVIHSLHVGGAEGQVYELAKGLDKDRYEPVVCALTGRGAYIDKLRTQGVKVEVLGSRLRQLPYTFFKLVRLIRRERFDIVQNFMFTAGVIGTIAGRTLGVPIVINCIRSLGFLRYHHRRPLKRVMYKVSDCVVANSRQTASLLVARGITQPTKIRVIYNGVDTNRFKQGDRKFEMRRTKSRLGIGESDPVIGIIANLTAVKNHDCFLRAVPLVLKEFPRAGFFIIGGGPLREHLRAVSQALHVQSHVFFLGERQDIADLLRVMDISVLCSRREGFSNVILESMASGLPVIASNVGGNPEAVVEGQTGLLFEPEQSAQLAAKILLLLRDQARRVQMGNEARKRAEAVFSKHRMIENYQELYQRLLSNKALATEALEASLSR